MGLLQLLDYPSFLLELLSGRRTRSELSGAKRREADLAEILPLSEPRKILDLANGRLRPQYEILRAAGHQIVGIDLANYPRCDVRNMLYKLARSLFCLHLERKRSTAEALVYGDVGVLPFGDNCFDLVTSVAAFEHFLDVPRVLAELKRVIRPGGALWIMIHPFTSPSGGHNVHRGLGKLESLPPGIEAWDHLRRRKLGFTVPLNEWRIAQYVEEFEKHFELLNHYAATVEGRGLLTTELRDELSAYSEEELTAGCYVIVATRR